MKRLFEALVDMQSDEFPAKRDSPAIVTHVTVQLEAHDNAAASRIAAQDPTQKKLLFPEGSPADVPLPYEPPLIPGPDLETHLIPPDSAPVVEPLPELPPKSPVQEAETQVLSDSVDPRETSQSEAASPHANDARTEPAPSNRESVLMNNSRTRSAKSASILPISLKVPRESRLVAITAPNSMGAEKFRALVSRLEHLHKRSGLKCFQVTSSMINEGKTLISANVALSLAKHLGAKTLLIEGDLHRPTLGTILGLGKMRGLSHWWSGQDQDLDAFVRRLDDLPLSFLPAGTPSDSPSDILRSTRFVEAFERLTSQFDWVVVDSTPILPIVDVNLWSRLVQGTLLVIREGVTPVKALQQGLLALDHPNLIGVVLNEASATNEAKYNRHYYSSANR